MSAVTMLKTLLLVCVAWAHFAVIFADSTVQTYEAQSIASSSSSSSSATASSSSYSNYQNEDDNNTSYSPPSSSSSSNSSSISCTNARCGKNERYVQCPIILCVPYTCDQLGGSISCPRIDPRQCPDKPACVCIEGYVRNSRGNCIPKSQCPSCGGDPNAQAGCGFACSKRCGSTKPVPKDCPCGLNGCVCKPGFIYDDQQRKCVKPCDCSKPCKKNEIYSTCANGGCGKWNCTQYDEGILCIDPIECIGDCICREDYLRAPNGTCIPQDDCPAALCPNPNEVYDACPFSCPPRQCGINDAAVLCAADQECLPPGCRCRDGFYRNDKDECVSWEDCPTCPDNEVYTTCANGGCGKWNCTQFGGPDLCIDPIKCKGGCICQDGYLRAPNGTCIPQDNCPAALCPKPNELYDWCPYPCPPRQCGTNDAAVLCAADQECLPPGCRCRDGFYRNDKDECVAWEDCPTCPENEVYTTCANGGCGKWNCTQFGGPDLCIDPIKCKGGCICQDGYLRAPNGTCIPQDNCPAALCPKPNEVYDWCPYPCPPRQCGTNDAAVLCAADQECLPPGCRCRDGFYRNDKDECVAWEDCPSCSQTGPTYACDDSVDKLLAEGNYVWTSKFMQEALTQKPNKSAIMSPWSVFIPIGELALYSEGDTYNQLIKTLNLRSKDDIRCVYPRLISGLRAQANVILNVANRIFSTDTYPLSDQFLDDTKTVFDAEPEPLDFSQPADAADRINEWVANQTNDRITDIANKEMFTPDTRLVLANAIYFLGNWIRQFNPNNTENRDFYVDSQNTVKIPFMYQESSFRYGESLDLDCKILEMPYKGDNFTFLVYLPNDIEGLPALVNKLQQSQAFYDSYDAMSYEKVKVYLPKVKTESEYDLSKIMKSAGMTDIFNAAKSNLQGILKQYEPLYISAANQKAFCDINETGTEAAADNVIIVGTTAVMQTYTFEAKHPYVYYIVYKQPFPIPLFVGTFYVVVVGTRASRPLPAYTFDANLPFMYYIMYKQQTSTPIFTGTFFGDS